MAIEHFGNKLRFFPHRAGLEIEGQQVAPNLLDHVARWLDSNLRQVVCVFHHTASLRSGSRECFPGMGKQWSSRLPRLFAIDKTGGGPVPSGSRGKDWTERMPGIIAGMVW